MVDVISVGYCIFGAFLIGILAFNFLLVKYYIDPAESYALATVVTMLSFSVTLMCVLLIPLDIFIASGQTKYLEISHDTIRELFFWLFICMLVLAFVLIPFTYFYGEERFDDEIDDDRVEFCDKVCEAMKYTAGFMLVCAVLVIVGLIFRPSKEDWGEGKEWIRQMFDVDHVGEEAISFTVACLTMVGVSAWSLYSAYGLASLPWLLIKGTKSLEQTKNELDVDLSKLREKKREIQGKSQKSNTRPTRKEKKELARLTKQEQRLLMKTEKLSELQKDRPHFITTVLKFLTPFRVMLGITAACLSILIFGSLFLGAIDRLLNSECGFSCGFMATQTSVFNPLDTVLVYFSTMFPLDYLLFGILMLYIFISSLFGIVSSGVKLLCVTIYTIKKKRTLPQGLLLASITMMLVFLGISIELLTILPSYTTFGSQTFTNSEVIPTQSATVKCTLENFNPENCTMSNLSSIFNRISVSIPLFSTIIYLFNWLFLAVFLVYFVNSATSKPNSTFEDETEEDEEESLLL